MGGLLSFRFLLRRDQADTNGRHSVVLRLIHQRQKLELATGLRVLPQEWNEDRQTAPKNLMVVEQLQDWQTRVLELRRRYLLEDRLVVLSDFKVELTGGRSKSISLLDYFTQRIERIRVQQQEFALGTVKGYVSTLNHIKAFLAQEGITSLTLEQLTASVLGDFDHYLLSKQNAALGRPMQRNGASKHHTRLRAVLSHAMREELIERNPYRSFRLKFERTNREFLTTEELSRLASLDLSRNASLERVRDIFMFSVYSGLRYKDAMSLEPKHLSVDAQGRSWLAIVQQKTGDALRVPVLNEAIRALDKYKDEARITGKLLPRLSNQKLNAYLKVLADLAEITRPLTHHVARHTFATTITLSNNVSLEVVSKLLGHQNLKTTQIYAKITADHLGSVATRLDATLAR